MKKLLAILKIIRPINILITFIVVIVAALICSTDKIITEKIILAAFSASLIASSGNIINDIFDYNIDLINRAQRALPSKEISIGFAIVLYIVFTATGLLISQMILWELFFIAISVVLILLLYSYLLKGIPIIGNIAVSICTSLAFIYGGVTVNNWKAAIVPAMFAFLVTMIREIIKDVEDLKGDLQNNVFTFPAKFGLRKTKIILIFLIILLIILTFYPFIKAIYSIEYFLIVLFTVDLLLIYFIREIVGKMFIEKVPVISKLLKLCMVFGLIAIYFGNF